jgi:hypothetical protein
MYLEFRDKCLELTLTERANRWYTLKSKFKLMSKPWPFDSGLS